MKLTRLVFPFSLFATGCAAFGADDATPVSFMATPIPVQQVIRTQVANGTLGEIDRSHDGWDTTYDVSFTARNGQEQGFTVSQDGMILSVEVPLASTPPAVQQTIKSQATGWTLEGIDKNLDEMPASYDVEVFKGGQDRSFTISESGALLSAEVNLAQTPVIVQSAIEAQLSNGRLGTIDENFDSDGINYDVEVIAKFGKRISFTVGPDGAVLSQEVALEEVPPAALRAIQTQTGMGTIVRVDKSFEDKDDSGLPYEVEARKDGKEFNFSVGPGGDFLGMDD